MWSMSAGFVCEDSYVVYVCGFVYKDSYVVYTCWFCLQGQLCGLCLLVLTGMENENDSQNQCELMQHYAISQNDVIVMTS